MTKEKDIQSILKTVSTNRKAFIVFIIISVLTGVFLIGKYFTPQKKAAGDCDYFIEQNRQLVNSLLEIRSGVNDAIGKPVSYTGNRNYIMFASYDTVPPTQQKLLKVLAKIDSILIQRKLDSLKRLKTTKG